MTTYSEEIMKFWHSMDHDPYIDTWEEGLDYPLAEYNPLLCLRIRLDNVGWFLGFRFQLQLPMTTFFSDLCVDLSLEPYELHDKNLDQLLSGFIPLADIFVDCSGQPNVTS